MTQFVDLDLIDQFTNGSVRYAQSGIDRIAQGSWRFSIASNSTHVYTIRCFLNGVLANINTAYTVPLDTTNTLLRVRQTPDTAFSSTPASSWTNVGTGLYTVDLSALSWNTANTYIAEVVATATFTNPAVASLTSVISGLAAIYPTLTITSQWVANTLPSSPASLTAGSGIDITSGVVSFKASDVAGAGLVSNGASVLDINPGSGISIVGDAVTAAVQATSAAFIAGNFKPTVSYDPDNYYLYFRFFEADTLTDLGSFTNFTIDTTLSTMLLYYGETLVGEHPLSTLTAVSTGMYSFSFAATAAPIRIVIKLSCTTLGTLVSDPGVKIAYFTITPGLLGTNSSRTDSLGGDAILE